MSKRSAEESLKSPAAKKANLDSHAASGPIEIWHVHKRQQGYPNETPEEELLSTWRTFEEAKEAVLADLEEYGLEEQEKEVEEDEEHGIFSIETEDLDSGLYELWVSYGGVLSAKPRSPEPAIRRQDSESSISEAEDHEDEDSEDAADED